MLNRDVYFEANRFFGCSFTGQPVKLVKLAAKMDGFALHKIYNYVK